jgi:uncharacterized membrane protein
VNYVRKNRWKWVILTAISAIIAFIFIVLSIHRIIQLRWLFLLALNLICYIYLFYTGYNFKDHGGINSAILVWLIIAFSLCYASIRIYFYFLKKWTKWVCYFTVLFFFYSYFMFTFRRLNIAVNTGKMA